MTSVMIDQWDEVRNIKIRNANAKKSDINIKRNRIHVKASNSGPATESQMDCHQDHIKFMVERIQREGFINFFGTQRLGAAGERGTSAFLIGKAMIQKKFKLAIDLLMVGREHGEHEVSKKVRKIWNLSTSDMKE